MFGIDEIIWGHVRGYPWWPCRVVSPTPAQLKRLSIDEVPSDHRFVWFFNDDNNYTLINVKDIRPFCDHRITVTKGKKSRRAEKLEQAYSEAREAYHGPVNLQDDDPEAIAIAPSEALQPSISKRISQKSRKRKISNSTISPHLSTRRPKQMKIIKLKQEASFDAVDRDESHGMRTLISQKKLESTSRRPSADADSKRRSTLCNLSSCDRTSLGTGVNSRIDMPAAKETSQRRILLRLRIKERPNMTKGAKRNDSHMQEPPDAKHHLKQQGECLSSYGRKVRKKARHYPKVQSEALTDLGKVPTNKIAIKEDLESCEIQVGRSGKDKMRIMSYRHPKLQSGAVHIDGDELSKRGLTAKAGAAVSMNHNSLRPECLSDETARIESKSAEPNVTSVRRSAARKPNDKFRLANDSEKISPSDLALRRSERQRKKSSKVVGMDVDDDRKCGNEEQLPVASKRSRGVEAPRMSHGHRRFRIRDKEDGKCDADTKNQVESKNWSRSLAKSSPEQNLSDYTADATTKPFQNLSKDECVEIIIKMQRIERRRSVEIWLRGRQLVKGAAVLRTEEGLITACEPAVEKAEKLLRWAKKNEGSKKGGESRFTKMEKKAVEECKVLVNVYFDRKKVSLKKTGSRILKVARELSPYSRQVSEVLRDLLVLWVDLTTYISFQDPDLTKKNKRALPIN